MGGALLLVIFTIPRFYIPGEISTKKQWKGSWEAMRKLKSHALQPEAKIGVIAPASPLNSCQEIDQAVSYLSVRGYPVVLGVTAVPMMGYLAGSDIIRQADLEDFWQDETIQAIWCLRGGYGSGRLLSGLWYGLIAKKPKILIGFSDITALELGIWSQVNLITFHGPVLTNLNSRFTITNTFKILSGTWSGPLEWPAGDLASYTPIRSGRACGIMLGGNLSTLCSLIGTRFLPDFDNVILFLEEIGERAYRIDRMLTQLIMSGLLDSVAAVLIGRSIPATTEVETELVEVFKERLSILPCPVAYGFPIGHNREQWTIPQGVTAEVDTEKGCLILLENPVIV